MSKKGTDEASTETKSKKILTEKQKKKIFDKYTKHFNDFLSGRYVDKCTCDDEDSCSCSCSNLEVS